MCCPDICNDSHSCSLLSKSMPAVPGRKEEETDGRSESLKPLF